MKTLILTCNTGQGHNATASALRESFLRHGESCEIKDALSFLSVLTSRAVGRIHTGVYRSMPRAFGNGYKMAEEHPHAFARNTPLWHALNGGRRRVYRYLTQGNYDTVICTHAFSALMLSGAMEHYPTLRPKTCFIATDYTCSPSVNESRLDAYIIPDADLIDEFVHCGIPRDRVYGLGIPVRDAFAVRGDRLDAKKELGLPTNGKHLVMMCGSMGCGPMEKMTDLLLSDIPSHVTVSVVCGTNASLQKKLSKKHTDDPRLRVYGFVDNVSLMMDSADLYLTKPGGISVSEAAAKQLPMVLIDAVAGCEEYNLRFFLERGMARTAGTPTELVSLCLSLLRTEENELDSMAAAMAQYAHPHAADAVYDLMKNMPLAAVGKPWQDANDTTK